MPLRVAESIRRLNPTAGTILVAVSGGPDSVALLSALVEAGAYSVAIGHVNHQLRGDESDGDMAFVSQLALSFRVKCHIAQSPVSPDASNLESVARRRRYHALARLAKDAGATTIATGHTLDDLAETVLHRIVRGTGLDGLAAILPRRRLGASLLIRPMLAERRSVLMEYLLERQQQFRIDSSNLDRRFTRNRIRSELIPSLRNFNPSIIDNLARLAEVARRTRQTIRRLARRDLAHCELPRAGDCCIFAADRIAKLPANRIVEVFRLVWRRERWPRDGMTLAHWDQLPAVGAGRQSALDLPGGVRISRRERVVRLGPGA